MKTTFLLAALLAFPLTVRAAEIDPASVQLWDVIHTADGSVLVGVIVEEVPGVSVRIVIAGGTSLVVQMTNVTKFAKELNPAYGNAPARDGGGTASPGAARPARMATSGLRLALTPGFADHFESDVSTFFVTTRAGWEIAFEQWGLTPGVVVDIAPLAGPNEQDAFGILGGLRAAYRGSSISPFVGFGLGMDAVGDDTSLGTFMGAGIDLLVHPKIALSAELKYHRGWGNSNTYTMSFVALGMGVELRL